MSNNINNDILVYKILGKLRCQIFNKRLRFWHLNFILFYAMLIIGLSPQYCIAQSTTPLTFSSTLSDTSMITNTNSIITTSIDVDSGILNGNLKPSFTIITNSRGKYLTQSWACNTTTTSQNAIFKQNSQTYIILTNNTILPAVSAITNIKSGSATPSSNSNAIAYMIDAPTNIVEFLDVTYDNTYNYWTLYVRRHGIYQTSQTIPSNSPLSGTYSNDDEPGNYQSTVTLSFNP